MAWKRSSVRSRPGPPSQLSDSNLFTSFFIIVDVNCAKKPTVGTVGFWSERLLLRHRMLKNVGQCVESLGVSGIFG